MPIKALVNKKTRSFLRRCIAFIKRHPGLRFIPLLLARKLGLDRLLHTINFRFSVDPLTLTTKPVTAMELTPHSRHIYAELKDAIAKQQSENN